MTVTATNPNSTPPAQPATPAGPAVPTPPPAPQTDPTLSRIVTVLAVGEVFLVAAFLFYVLVEHPALGQPVQAVLGLLGLVTAGGSILVTLHALNRRP
ncbi:hypothetical protein ACFYMW_39860 [Streptomyces sp. NPDC006692]|uniref:hypothetical protein n=1 Tax=Streptomyces sp. NPDC006692 TaxID=3364758 RepID=UPI0036B61139